METTFRFPVRTEEVVNPERRLGSRHQPVGPLDTRDLEHRPVCCAGGDPVRHHGFLIDRNCETGRGEVTDPIILTYEPLPSSVYRSGASPIRTCRATEDRFPSVHRHHSARSSSHWGSTNPVLMVDSLVC